MSQSGVSFDSIGEQIRTILRERILAGFYRVGQRLVEVDIAQEFDVSRTPVRNAILRLEAEGLVQLYPRKGVIVSALTEPQILEVFEIRLALEPLAVELAARYRTPLVIKTLDKLLESMETALEAGDESKLAMAHVHFHRTIYEAANRPRLLDILSGLLGLSQHFSQESYRFFGRDAAALNEHQWIAEAIRVRDTAAAARLASQHIVAAKDTFLRIPEMDLQRDAQPE